MLTLNDDYDIALDYPVLSTWTLFFSSLLLNERPECVTKRLFAATGMASSNLSRTLRYCIIQQSF